MNSPNSRALMAFLRQPRLSTALVIVALLSALLWCKPTDVQAQDPAVLEVPATEVTKSDDVAKAKSDLPRVSTNNTLELKKLVDKDVVVTGKVNRINRSSSGHQFLNFYSSELSVVCFKKSLELFKDGTPADLYVEKQVEVTGRLELYNGKLQIKLHRPEQIQLADEKKSNQPAGVKLKQIDKDTFLSPAGLRYDGYDPEGLTRVEHILRHTKDQPDREGSHGVFDGDQDVAFAVIDDAWKLAEKKKLRPENEAGRSSYLVPMGRRVGYLGGQAGKRRNNPPLERVFIVFKTGTKDIVTAFPR